MQKSICIGLPAETHSSTHVFVKSPPAELPMSRQSCWEKNTQVISCNVEPVWHFRSMIVGPRKAMLSPKLKNTLQYVSVCWQFLRKSVNIRSSINIAWKSPIYSTMTAEWCLDVPVGGFQTICLGDRCQNRRSFPTFIFAHSSQNLCETLLKLMPKNKFLTDFFEIEKINDFQLNCQWFWSSMRVVDKNVIRNVKACIDDGPLNN